MFHRILLMAGAAAALQGCAAPTLYRWGAYDEALYTHYKKPQEREAFVADLKEVVLQAEQAGVKVPPGCYAEYGYALYEEGQYQDAVAYFGKERDQWPESRVLMQKLIANAERRSGRGSPPTSPAESAPPAPTKAPAATRSPAVRKAKAGAATKSTAGARGPAGHLEGT